LHLNENLSDYIKCISYIQQFSCHKPLTYPSFEAFTAVMFHVDVFWVLTPSGVAVGCHFHPEDGDSTDL
jgi:hypothetical protein